MRDFRDAKAMARSRDALTAKAVETSHSESLELIASAMRIGISYPPRSMRYSHAPARRPDTKIQRTERSSIARSAVRTSRRCAN
jgi:hypothetical protein